MRLRARALQHEVADARSRASPRPTHPLDRGSLSPSSASIASHRVSSRLVSARRSRHPDRYALRPDTRYRVDVFEYTRHVSSSLGATLSKTTSDTSPVASSTYFTSLTTGYPRFDLAPLASLSGPDAPSWRHLTMAYEALTHEHTDQRFEGVIAIDTDGWVVWCVVVFAAVRTRAPARRRRVGSLRHVKAL